MIRAAAKNRGGVGVVTDPSQYALVIEEVRSTGALSDETRARLAREAFRRTAQYDAAIARYLTSESEARGDFPARVTLEQSIAWRLYTKGTTSSEAERHARIEGDDHLAKVALRMVSVIA